MSQSTERWGWVSLGQMLLSDGILTQEQLAQALARQRKNAPPVETVKIAGVNHLLVPATTGEVDEYARLTDRHVSPAVTEALVVWLKKLS